MADDDLDDFDLDEDDAPSGESGVPAPTDIDDDDDFDFDDDFDEFDEGGGASKFKQLWETKKKLILIASGAVVALGAIGGGAWWFFAGDDTAEMAQGSSPSSVAGAVGMALQQQSTSGLTPPSSKLTAGGVTGGGKLVQGGDSKLTAGGAATMAATVTGGMGGYDPQNQDTPLTTAAVGDVGVSIPAVLPRNLADLGAPQQAQPLAQAVDKNLMEVTDHGLLPAVSADGQEPWKVYARPFSGDPNAPVVGLVVTGLGMSSSLTEAAINHLPADVTLSFSAYGSGLKEWVTKARAMGHEVLLELPMEAETFPADDPGPMAMMTSKSAQENLKLLNLLMGTAQGYVGFVGQFGSKFTRDRKAMTPVLGEMKTRGLFFMAPKTADRVMTLEMADQMQLARALTEQIVQTDTSPARIRAQLETLATLAKNSGLTTALVQATPASLKSIKSWAADLQGVSLSPMTSLAGRQRS